MHPVPLFLDGRDAARALEELDVALAQVRRAMRYLTKCESPAGVSAHQNAYSAEGAIERAIGMIRGH